MTMKPVVVTTRHRGVFVGLMDDATPLDAEIVQLERCRMAISFKATGVVGLANGPSGDVSGMAPTATIRDVTAIFGVTEDGWKAWDAFGQKKGQS